MTPTYAARRDSVSSIERSPQHASLSSGTPAHARSSRPKWRKRVRQWWGNLQSHSAPHGAARGVTQAAPPQSDVIRELPSQRAERITTLDTPSGPSESAARVHRLLELRFGASTLPTVEEELPPSYDEVMAMDARRSNALSRRHSADSFAQLHRLCDLGCDHMQVSRL